MTPDQKLQEVLTELKAERSKLDAKIGAIETALGDRPERKKRGRKPKVESPTTA